MMLNLTITETIYSNRKANHSIKAVFTVCIDLSNVGVNNSKYIIMRIKCINFKEPNVVQIILSIAVIVYGA